MKKAPQFKNAPTLGGRACGYCGGPHPVSDYVAAESPFCTSCLHERIAARVAKQSNIAVIETSGRITITSSRRETLGSELS